MLEYETGQRYYVLSVEVLDRVTMQVVQTLVTVLEGQSVVQVVVPADEVEYLFAYVVSLLLHSQH